MSFFALSCLLIVFFSIITIAILSIYGKKKVHQLLVVFHFALILWGLGSFLFQFFPTNISVWKIGGAAVWFTTPIAYHFTLEFLSIRNNKKVRFFYLFAIFTTILYLNFDFDTIALRFQSIYFPINRSVEFKAMFLLWLIPGFDTLQTLFMTIKRSEGEKWRGFKLR